MQLALGCPQLARSLARPACRRAPRATPLSSIALGSNQAKPASSRAPPHPSCRARHPQVHYHLPASKQFPQGLSVRVWRRYEEFVAELTARFPHEREGIRKLYDDCWRVFNRWVGAAAGAKVAGTAPAQRT